MESKTLRNPLTLYNSCIKAAVRDCASLCKTCGKDFRILPNHVLFDFYFKVHLDKHLTSLAEEFSQLQIFNRMLSVKHKRVDLLRIFQALIDHNSINIPKTLYESYQEMCLNTNEYNQNIIDMGIRIGSFLIEGSWYEFSIKILNATEECCKKFEQTPEILKKCLDCYHKRIYSEAIYCEFELANETFKSAQETIKKLKELNELPNLAGLYANFSLLFLIRTEYDSAYFWSRKALELLTDDVPQKILIEVLRQASKICVTKRLFQKASLLIRQAVNLASNLYENTDSYHVHHAETLLDYGFFLLTFDSINESVQVYLKALEILTKIFMKNNIHIARAHEDLAYALYVKEYSSGRFYLARDNSQIAIHIMEKLVPPDHFLLASAKRVKALILEEMAIDLRETPNIKLHDEYLLESEQLHKAALELSYKSFGEKNVQTAKHYANLGRLYQTMKLYDRAEEMHLHAIQIKEELLGKNDFEVGLSMGHLASLYNYHMQRHLDAEKLYLRSIEINMNLFGETYSGFEYDYRGLINVYEKLSDQTNMSRYTIIMRDWQKLREGIQPICNNQDLLPINIIKEKFFSM